MESYNAAVTAIKKLSTGTFRNRQAYVDQFKGITAALNKVADEYAEIGHNKLSTSVLTLRNKLQRAMQKVADGKLSSVSEIKELAKEAVRSMAALSPKTADKIQDKAGISDQSKVFAGFNKKRVALSTDSATAAFKLEKAPMLLLFKNRITGVQEKLLKSFGATFYQGTNGVSIPSVPILVLNKRVVAEKDFGRTVKSILRSLKRPDLAVFMNDGVTKRNYVAFPVFEPKHAEIMSVIFFDSLQSKELWVS